MPTMSEQQHDPRRPESLTGAAIRTFATNGATVSFSLLNVLILARALGPSGRGEVAFVIAVFVLTSGLATLGIEQANANLGGQRTKLRPQLATNSLIAAGVLGLLAAAVVGSIMALIPTARGEVDLGLLLFALLWLPSGIAGLNLKLLLQSDYRFGITNLAWIASPAVTAVVNGTLALNGELTVQRVIVVFVATNLLATMILVFSAARHFGFGRPDLALARDTLSFGLKTHTSTVLGLGAHPGDQWLLGMIAGPYALGLYSIAVSIAEALYYIVGIIVLVQRPHLVRAGAAGAAEFAARIFRRAVLLSGSAGGVLFVIAPTLCVLLFGDEFRDSGYFLRILALGAVGVLAHEFFQGVVIAQGRPLLATVGATLVVSTLIVMNLLLTPSMGGEGAAIAKTLAFSAGGVVMVTIFLRHFGQRASALVPRREDVLWYWRTLRKGIAYGLVRVRSSGR